MTERDRAAHAGDAITHLEKPDIRVFQTTEALAHEAARVALRACAGERGCVRGLPLGRIDTAAPL